jgi:hypothetical protein
MLKAKQARSPLKANPLHNPGQSLDAAIQDLVIDRVFGIFMAGTLFTVLAIIEWLQLWLESPPKPIPLTVIAVLIWIFGYYRLVKVKGKLTALKQGRDGEKAVGQYLEKLRQQGAEVYHDIPASNFNVDHVVIAPQGVFVIETKTISKPISGRADICIKDGKVWANGQELERNPMEQVQAIAKWVSELLQDTTGKSYPTIGVVVFPGWFVKPDRQSRTQRIWLLNPKALPAFITAEPAILPAADVKLASYHLSRYVRTHS